jgi:tetratricopeptide (TPR) repeat protein
MSQRALATRTSQLHAADPAIRAISERTVISLEAERAGAARSPRGSTVRSLAAALALAPNSPEYAAFFAAARASGPAVDRETAPSPTVDPDAVFIEAGREPHLARLAEAIDDAVGGTAGVVLVSASPGTGKSRLIEAACERAIDRHPGLVVLWTECISHIGAGISHEPFRMMIASMAGDPLAHAPRDLPAANTGRLHDRLPSAVRALATGANDLIGTLTPATTITRSEVLDALDEDARHRALRAVERRAGQPVARADIERALWRLLEGYGLAGPVVLVIEDLHLADPATRDALDHIVERLASRRLPLLIIGSMRPAELTPASPSGAISPRLLVDHVVQRFPGANLDLSTAVGGDAGRAFTAAVVANLGPDDPTAMTELLFERTEGQPLYLMSFLRLWALTGDASLDGQLPGEIHAVFEWQLSRMTPSARGLIEAASVQGIEFLGEPLMLAMDRDAEDARDAIEAELGPPLRQVLARGDIVIDGRAVHRYRFSHALVREHVYNGLSDIRRAHLHGATAAALVEIFGERGHDGVETIAGHFELAGNAQRAATAWIDAGDRAMERADYLHSLDIFRRVTGMGIAGVGPGAHLQALIGVGNSLRGLGRPREARANLQQARIAARGRQLHTVHANALTSLGVLDFDRGDMVAGAARFTESIAAHEQAGDLREAGRSTANLSFALHGMGQYDAAMDRALKAIDMARAVGDVTVRSTAELAEANCWLELGYYDHAIALYEALMERCIAHGLTHRVNLCLINIALGNVEMERWSEATQAIDAMLRPERRPVERLRAVAAFNGALVAEGQGNLDAADRLYEESREIRARLDQKPLLVDSLAGLLRIAMARGHTAAMGRLLADITGQLEQRGLIGIEHLGRLFVTLVETSRALGDEIGAERHLTEALALLDTRAASIADPEQRQRYLTGPAAHRRLRGLARQRHVEEATHLEPDARR